MKEIYARFLAEKLGGKIEEGYLGRWAPEKTTDVIFEGNLLSLLRKVLDNTHALCGKCALYGWIETPDELHYDDLDEDSFILY